MQQPFARAARTLAVAATLMAIVAGTVAIDGETTASAAPAHCSEPEAPPACTPGPSPSPTPPKNLESGLFNFISHEQNYLTVQMNQVDASAVAPYSSGDTTRFRVSVACANGFFFSGFLKYVRSDSDNYLRLSTVIAGGDATGQCRVTTWDQDILGMKHVSVSRESSSGTYYTLWRVWFTR